MAKGIGRALLQLLALVFMLIGAFASAKFALGLLGLGMQSYMTPMFFLVALALGLASFFSLVRSSA